MGVGGSETARILGLVSQAVVAVLLLVVEILFPLLGTLQLYSCSIMNNSMNRSTRIVIHSRLKISPSQETCKSIQPFSNINSNV